MRLPCGGDSKEVDEVMLAEWMKYGTLRWFRHMGGESEGEGVRETILKKRTLGERKRGEENHERRRKE